MRRGRAKTWTVFAMLAVVCIIPALAANGTGGGNTSTATGGNQTLTPYQEAVETATHPASYEQGVALFTALGGWLVVLAGVPILIVFVLGGIAGYWDDTAFWAVVLIAAAVTVMVVTATPSLLVALR